MKKFGGGASHREAFHTLVCDAAKKGLGTDGGKGAFEGAFLAACVALLDNIKAKDPAMLDKALIAFDCDPFVYYFILAEPFRENGLVPDACFEGLTLATNDACGSFLAYHGIALGKGGEATNIISVARDIGKASKIAELGSAVTAKYEDAFKAGADCHLWQDFFRYFGSQLANFVRMSFPVDEADEYGKMMERVKEWGCCDYAKGPQRAYLNPPDLCPAGGRREVFSTLLRVINSSDFLHVPRNDKKGAGSANPFSCETYLREGYALAALNEPNSAAAMSADKSTRACLETFLKSCGSLEKAAAIVATVSSKLGLPN